MDRPDWLTTGRNDAAHGDECGYWPTAADEARIEQEERAWAKHTITDAAWWNEALEGINEVTGTLPLVMHDCMRQLDDACGGDEIARNGVLSALCRLQRSAFVQALKEAEGRELGEN